MKKTKDEILKEVHRQALYLAKANCKANRSIKKVYWFPSPKEVRLLEVTEEVGFTDDKAILPLYYREEPQYGLPFSMGVAWVHPAQYRNRKLPKGWRWADALEIRVLARKK